MKEATDRVLRRRKLAGKDIASRKVTKTSKKRKKKISERSALTLEIGIECLTNEISEEGGDDIEDGNDEVRWEEPRTGEVNRIEALGSGTPKEPVADESADLSGSDPIADRSLTTVENEGEVSVNHCIPFTKREFHEWLRTRHEAKFGDQSARDPDSIWADEDPVDREMEGIHNLLCHAQQVIPVKFRFEDGNEMM